MGEEDTNGPKNETFFWGATNDGPKPRHFVFGYVTSGPSRRPFFLGEGEGQNRSGPKTRLFLFLGNITNGPETRLCFVSVGRGGQKQDCGDNWIPEALRCRWHLDGLFLQRHGGMCTCTRLELRVQREFFPITVAGRIDGL